MCDRAMFLLSQCQFQHLRRLRLEQSRVGFAKPVGRSLRIGSIRHGRAAWLFGFMVSQMAYEAWQYRDPMLVLQRKQEQAARTKQGKAEAARAGLGQLFKEPTLDQDTSAQIDDLLDTWYRYEAGYMPALGGPRVSPSCRGHVPDTGEVHDTSGDRDAKLEKATAEAVEACVDELVLLHRVAIQNRMRNKTAGAAVFRHPMLGTPERAHELYQEAKGKLWPMMKRKGMV